VLVLDVVGTGVAVYITGGRLISSIVVSRGAPCPPNENDIAGDAKPGGRMLTTTSLVSAASVNVLSAVGVVKEYRVVSWNGVDVRTAGWSCCCGRRGGVSIGSCFTRLGWNCVFDGVAINKRSEG